MNDLEEGMTQERRETIVLRLRDLKKYWSEPRHLAATGGNLPEWLHSVTDWDSLLAQLMGDAADLIEDAGDWNGHEYVGKDA